MSLRHQRPSACLPTSISFILPICPSEAGYISPDRSGDSIFSAPRKNLYQRDAARYLHAVRAATTSAKPLLSYHPLPLPALQLIAFLLISFFFFSSLVHISRVRFARIKGREFPALRPDVAFRSLLSFQGTLTSLPTFIVMATLDARDGKFWILTTALVV